MNPPSKLSKTEIVYKALEKDILNGVWAVGSIIPTEIELAKTFGCNRATIAKAITGLMQEGLVERRKRGGTRVLSNVLNSFRQGLELDAFACIYPSEDHEAIRLLLQGFQSASLEKGRRLLMLPTGLDFRRETELLASLTEFDVLGAVACPVTATPSDQLNVQSLLLKSRVPIVLMGAYHPGFAAGNVYLDHFSVGYEMTRYLLSQNIQRIGFLANWSWSEFIRERFNGYSWAMREAGIEVSKKWTCLANQMHPNFEDPVSEPMRIAREYLATQPDVEAVVCADDFLAIGLIDAAREVGLAVPENLKVTGVDDLSTAATAPVPLTTYHVPYEEMGRKSFELLNDIVNRSRPSGENMKCLGHVVVRDSA